MMFRVDTGVSRLRTSLFANYAVQIYTSFIGIALLPFYLRYLGYEAYGLIGFLALLQAWLQLLDCGVCGTISREAARHRGGATTSKELVRHFRNFERFLVIVGSAVAITVAAEAHAIVTHWLRPHELTQDVVGTCVMIIAIILPLRWMSIFYRSLLSGFEKQIWLASFGSMIATVRFVLVVPLIIYDRSVVDFFIFQLVVAVLESVVLAVNAHTRIRCDSQIQYSSLPTESPRQKWGFSLFIGFTALLSVVVVQSDKLILSANLPLSDYGQFTLAISLAGAVHLLASPIGVVTQPRLTSLFASDLGEAAMVLYRQATQILCVILAPVAITLALFSEQTLYVWVGDPVLSNKLAAVLGMYAAGNVLMAIAGMPYLLLCARGKPQMDTLGMLLLSFILVPAMYVSIGSYGIRGAGLTWMSAMSIYLLFWTPLIHHRYAPHLHAVWLRDIATVLLPAILTVGVLRALEPSINGRGSMAIYILLALASSFVAGAAACPFTRSLFVRFFSAPQHGRSA